MTSLVIAVSLLIAILLITVIAVPMMQQHRLLRTRAHFGGRLLVAQDQERAAIARELHDNITQRMLVAIMALRRVPKEPIAPIVQELDSLMDDLRSMARGLHPAVVDKVGLQAAIHSLGQSFEDRRDLRMIWSEKLEQEDLSPGQRLALYRVAQEALANVVRHAGVDTVRVSLDGSRGGIELTIEDAGKGFKPVRHSEREGLGMTSMEERLRLVGGTLRIESSPGHGTRVIARIPTLARKP